MPESLRAKEIVFDDDDELIKQFRPNLTPDQMFRLGSFGGTYWRPIRSNITKKLHRNRHSKFKKLGWWKDIPHDHLTRPWSNYDKSINKYKVKCGTTLRFWEQKAWITSSDPYGWVEWYCNFYRGRRLKTEDARQIKRWLAFCGPKGRFKNSLINKIKAKRAAYDDFSISPVIRQSLQHWGYQLTSRDMKS